MPPRSQPLLRVAGASKRHLFLAVPFAFYFATVAPSMGIADSAILMDAIQELRITTQVNNHNISVLLGWFFSHLPLDDPALEANLMSATVGAITIDVFYFLVLATFHSIPVAAASSTLLMVSHSMWWHSTIAESYAVNALFTVVAIFLLHSLRTSYRDRLLYALFFVAGLSFFNHVQLGIIGIGAAVFLLSKVVQLARQGKAREAALLSLNCSAACLVGLLPYLVTFAVDVSRSGTFAGTLHWAMGGSFRHVMFQGRVWSGLRDLGSLTVQQFPSPFLLAVGWGLLLLTVRWWGSRSLLALWAMFSVNAAFFMFYTTWDKFAFLLPCFVFLAFCGAFAIDSLVQLLFRKRSAVLAAVSLTAFLFSAVFPVYLYSKLSEWGRNSGFWYFDYDRFATGNTHDRAEYIANPNKRSFHGIEEFVTSLFEKLPENAIYIDSDFHHYFEVEFFQNHRRMRPDVKLMMINSWGIEGWGLSKKNFRSVLNNALRKNRDLFIASVGDPFAGYITQDWPERKYRFARFPLDDRRWIYKLITEEEARVSARDPGSASRVYDLTREDVVSQSSRWMVEDQPMYLFGDSWKNYDHVFVRANAPGVRVSFRLPSSGARDAFLKIGMTTANNFGVVDVEVNGKRVKENVDLYSSEPGVTVVHVAGVDLNPGDNVLSFEITGKRAESQSYRMGVDWVEVR